MGIYHHDYYYYQNITISDYIRFCNNLEKYSILQFKAHLLLFCNLLHVCLNFGVLFVLKLSASSLQTVTKCLLSRKLCK